MLRPSVWMTWINCQNYCPKQFADKADSSLPDLIDLICVPWSNGFAMASFKDLFYAFWSFANKYYEVTDKDSRIC